MRNIWLGLILVASGNIEAQQAAPVSQRSGTASTIVGEWKGETYAAGSTGHITIHFYPNGTYTRRVISGSRFGWTLEGDKLLLAPVTDTTGGETKFGKASVIGIALDRDSLIATADGESLTLKRVTVMVNESPLIGRWEAMTDLNEYITQDFMADGSLIVSVTVSREAGRYSASSKSITWTEQIPHPGTRRSNYELDGGKLSIWVARRLPPLVLTRVERPATPP